MILREKFEFICIISCIQCLMYQYIHCESDENKLWFGKNLSSTESVGSSSTNLFWQLTDIHWDLLYSEDGDASDMCHKSFAMLQGKSNGFYGNYLCDSPFTLVVSALNAMKDLEPHPKFILWTGDNAPHTSEVTFDVIFKTIRNLTTEMRSIFGSYIPLLPVLGNHDAYPKDNFPPSGETFYGRYLLEGNWKELIPTQAQTDFKKGGYYRTNLTKDVDVLVLNTNLYYRYNTIGQGLKDPGGQFAWMKQNLQQAKDEFKKVLVAAHAPPGYWERNPIAPFFNDSYNDQYVDILTEFGDVILAHIYGHQHTDSFKLFGTPNSVESVGFLAPSLTPWYPSRLKGGTSINPSLRLYTFSSSQMLDYVQYHMNLTEANNLTLPAVCPKDQTCNEELSNLWKEYYTATEFFEVDDLSVSDMTKVFKKLVNNDSFFQEYFLKNSAGIEHGYCNDTCKRIQLCALSHLKVDSVDQCVNSTRTEEYLNSLWNPSNHIGGYYVHNISPFSIMLKSALVSILTLIAIFGLMVMIVIIQRRNMFSSGTAKSASGAILKNRNGGYKPLRTNEVD